MSVTKTFNNTTYPLPANREPRGTWGVATAAFLQSVADNALSKYGGAFPLTGADINFGGSYGLISLYIKSVSPNIAQSGFLRLAKTDVLSFRNNANSADLPLGINVSDRLLFGSETLAYVSEMSTGLAGRQPLDGDLTAIAALNSTGLAKRTATDTWALTTPRAELPLTTKGDVLGDTGSALVRIPIGPDGYVFTANSASASGISWINQTALVSPSGLVVPFAGSTAPTGWVFCYGQAISRTTFSDLFAVIGTTYGVGDGSTTFNVPDLRGRVVAGKDNMGGTTASRLTSAAGITGTTLGAAGGDQLLQAHAHTVGSLVNTASSLSSAVANGQTNAMNTNQSHGHSINDPGHNHSIDCGINTPNANRILFGNVSNQGSLSTNASATGITVNNTNIDHFHTLTNVPVTGTANAQTISGSVASNGSGASQNVQPTIVLNQIIKL